NLNFTCDHLLLALETSPDEWHAHRHQDQRRYDSKHNARSAYDSYNLIHRTSPPAVLLLPTALSRVFRSPMPHLSIGETFFTPTAKIVVPFGSTTRFQASPKATAPTIC